jgi:hypothetical protein
VRRHGPAALDERDADLLDMRNRLGSATQDQLELALHTLLAAFDQAARGLVERPRQIAVTPSSRP